jgi:hypothetical protein
MEHGNGRMEMAKWRSALCGCVLKMRSALCACGALCACVVLCVPVCVAMETTDSI